MLPKWRRTIPAGSLKKSEPSKSSSTTSWNLVTLVKSTSFNKHYVVKPKRKKDFKIKNIDNYIQIQLKKTSIQ